MNNENYLKVVTYMGERLQGEVALLRTANTGDDFAEFLSFLGILAAIDVVTLLQPNEVSKQLDIVNKLKKYNEHYYQRLVLDMLVYANTMDGGWEGLATALHNSVKSLQESDFIPSPVSDRLDIESIKDPYIALIFIIKESATSTLVKEARRGVK